MIVLPLDKGTAALNRSKSSPSIEVQDSSPSTSSASLAPSSSQSETSDSNQIVEIEQQTPIVAKEEPESIPKPPPEGRKRKLPESSIFDNDVNSTIASSSSSLTSSKTKQSKRSHTLSVKAQANQDQSESKSKQTKSKSSKASSPPSLEDNNITTKSAPKAKGRGKASGKDQEQQQQLAPPPPTLDSKPQLQEGIQYQDWGRIPDDVEYGLQRVGKAIRESRRVIVITGAGISTPAIPDFRSSSGLFKTFANAEKGNSKKKGTNSAQEGEEDEGEEDVKPVLPQVNIKSGKELFDVKCLSDPDLLPHHHHLLNTLTTLTQRVQPSQFHHYLKRMDLESRLLRVYTQNIDGLEQKAGLRCGVPEEGAIKARRARERGEERERKAEREREKEREKEREREREESERRQREEEEHRVDEMEDPFVVSCLNASPASSQRSSNSSQSSEDRLVVEKGLEDLYLLADICSQRIDESCDRMSDSTLSVRSNRTDTSIMSTASERWSMFASQETLDAREDARMEAKLIADGQMIPRCVPLHGMLSHLHCTICSYTQPLEQSLPLPFELISCPACLNVREERIAAFERVRATGFLRASVVLYGEEHRQGEAIGSIVESDLVGRSKEDGKADLLIVAGTTLQIPGVKRMIKEFARGLKASKPTDREKRRRKTLEENEDSVEEDVDEKFDEDEAEEYPIRTILLNRDPPGKSKNNEWSDVFDVWIPGDLQSFVMDYALGGKEPVRTRSKFPLRTFLRTTSLDTPLSKRKIPLARSKSLSITNEFVQIQPHHLNQLSITTKQDGLKIAIAIKPMDIKQIPRGSSTEASDVLNEDDDQGRRKRQKRVTVNEKCEEKLDKGENFRKPNVTFSEEKVGRNKIQERKVPKIKGQPKVQSVQRGKPGPGLMLTQMMASNKPTQTLSQKGKPVASKQPISPVKVPVKRIRKSALNTRPPRKTAALLSRVAEEEPRSISPASSLSSISSSFVGFTPDVFVFGDNDSTDNLGRHEYRHTRCDSVESVLTELSDIEHRVMQSTVEAELRTTRRRGLWPVGPEGPRKSARHRA